MHIVKLQLVTPFEVPECHKSNKVVSSSLSFHDYYTIHVTQTKKDAYY